MKTSIFPQFSPQEYARRYQNIRHMMERKGVQALVIYGNSGMGRTAHSDIHYIANFLGNRDNFAVFPTSGEPALFAQSFNHVPDAQRASVLEDTQWGGPESAKKVAEYLSDLGVSQGEVGLVGGIPYHQYLILTESLPEVHFRNLTGAFRLLRVDKSDEEVEWMRRGAAFTDAAVRSLVEGVEPGMKEYQLGPLLDRGYDMDGGQNVFHYISSTSMYDSERCVPAQNQGERVIQKGDVILTEISIAYWGYAGQILRPISVAADPTPDYEQLYRVAEDAYYQVFEAIRPGVTAAEVLQAGACIDETEFTIVDGLLHGFGIGLLPPSLRTPATQEKPPQDFVFRPNQCIVIQPNIVTKDYQKGVQLGNLCLVTESGLEPLQKFPVGFARAG
jgi:Xaa-Pro aminopeptidase